MLLDDNPDPQYVPVVAFWYSSQECFVRWKNCLSTCFNISNGTRQGGVLSRYFFSRYIRDLISNIVNSGVGCKVSDHFINILAYADDIVLIAPPWRAPQQLLNVLQDKATAINMECNVKKTVAVVSTKKSS